MQKDPLLSQSEVDMVHNDHRNSYYPSDLNPNSNYTVNRTSTYADSTYEGYRPPTSGAGSLYQQGRNQSVGHLGPVETRQPKRLSDYGGEGYRDVQGFGSETPRGAGNERSIKRKSLGGAGQVQVYEDTAVVDDAGYGYNSSPAREQLQHGERRKSRSRGRRTSSAGGGLNY
jgi:hypothetical protein